MGEEGGVPRLQDVVRQVGHRPGTVESLESPTAEPNRSRGARTEYDLLAIGSGGAAFAVAIRATNLGARVALVERNTVGGTCVNTGCVPSKNLLAAAEAHHAAGHHPFDGITPGGRART